MSKLSDQPGRLPAGSRVEQDLSRYEGLGDDELEQILKGQKPDPTVEEDDVEEAEEADETAEEAEEDENSDEEDEAEDKEADKPDKDDGDDESAELTPLEKRMMLLERRLEKESLERERETERRKRAEMLASKQAGRAGYYKQQAEKGGVAKPAKDGSEDPEWVEGDEEKPEAKEGAEQPNLPPYWEEDRTEQVLATINDEGNKFTSERAEEFQTFDDPNEAKAFYQRFTELIEAEAGPYRQDFATSSLKSVRKLARSIMTSAFATAKIEYADKVGEKATVQKAESTAKNKRRKKKAAISKSGAPSKPKGGAKSYDEMTEEELEAEFQSEFGENYNARRDSLIS